MRRPRALYEFAFAPNNYDRINTLVMVDRSAMTNRRRAERAAKAIGAYGRSGGSITDQGEVREPIRTMVIDLLADLRHFCDGHGIAFVPVSDLAYDLYMNESKKG